MNQNNHIIPKSAYLLLPVLVLVGYMAFLPHQSYPYPLHLDEWLHLVRSDALMQAGSTTFLDPFTQSIYSLSANLEAGFHVFWGIFQRISGVSWLTIFRYFPAIILMFTVLATYVMAQRMGFGWEAALFACLIPTSVGILGPTFLVPVALGLFFIPLSLFVAFNLRSVWAYLVLFIFTCFLVAIHAPSAICLVIILVPYILLNLKSNFKHSLGIALAIFIPFLAPFPWIFDMLLPTAQKLFTPQALSEYVDFPRVIRDYGYLPIALCLLGTLVLSLRGGKRRYGLVLGLVALLAMLVTFYTFHFGIAIMYERGLLFMMLMVGIVAGAGLMWVKNLSLPAGFTEWLKLPLLTQNLGRFLCLVLVAVTLYITIPERQQTSYYYMIDEADYQAFTWIKENVSGDYGKAMLDPWQGAPFIAITGKRVYSWIHTAPQRNDEQAYKFLGEGCRDTEFLRDNGISIVYTRLECSNPDLVEVAENVYLLK